MKEGLLKGVSLLTLRPSYPLGNKDTPKASDAFLLSCQTVLLSFEYKGKPQILGGPSLFTLNNVWLPKKNGERKYKIPLKKKQNPQVFLDIKQLLQHSPLMSSV